MEKIKILFVCMTDSIHVVKYMRVFENDERFDVRLFPVYFTTPHKMFTKDVNVVDIYHINKLIKFLSPKYMMKCKLYNPIINSIIPLLRKSTDVNVFENKLFEKKLYKEILKFKPDYIHSMEFQHASYMVDNVRNEILNGEYKFPRWIVSNWGSDIYLYQHIPRHLSKIKCILNNCNDYISECERDVNIAKRLGLHEDKIKLPIIPNSGWFHNNMGGYIPNNERKYIIVKGYQGWSGRSFNAIEAIKNYNHDILKDYTIILYSCSDDVKLLMNYYGSKYNINYKIVPNDTDNETLINYFKNAKLYIGLGISDGISTSLIEAMGCGAIPIQSNTSCANEWITNTRNGFIVNPYEIGCITSIIELVLKNKCLNKICLQNIDMINNKLNKEKIENIILKRYL